MNLTDVATTGETIKVDDFEFEVVSIPTRGGRPFPAEEFPFRQLPVSQEVDGALTGPSIFIPKDRFPLTHLASARKRYKDRFQFATRKMERDGVEGTRVWKLLCAEK